MVQIETGRISSKGQIVIPARFRGRYKEGDNILFIDDGHSLILKVEGEMDEKLQEDLQASRRVKEAWERYDKGQFKTLPADQFLKELQKW